MRSIKKISLVKCLNKLGYSVYEFGNAYSEECLVDDEKKEVYVNKYLDDYDKARALSTVIIEIFTEAYKQEAQMNEETSKFYLHNDFDIVRQVKGQYWYDYVLCDEPCNHIKYYKYKGAYGCCSNPTENCRELTDKEHLFVLEEGIWLRIRRDTV